MLTYRCATTTSPAARTFLRGVHAVPRRPGLMGLDGVPPAATLSSCAARVRTRLRISPGAALRRTNDVGGWAFGAGAGATNSSRCLSGTTARHLAAEGKEGRESTRDAQPQPKGIRKVLPSLTPHENIYTVPNLLTFSRLVAAPFIGYAILHDAHALALGLFAYAGVSDLLDGWIARRWNLQTVVGSVVDPMADKLLMTVLTVCLAMQGALPVWLATIILGRDVGLGISAIYYRWISLPPPKTFTRYWDFSLPSAEVRPTTISKYNTFLQLGLMGATMLAPVVPVDVGGAMTAFQYLVATTTVWSGLSYVFSKDAVRILSEKKEQKSEDS
ncbi:CDP-alcohol phosphatidyltransferase-domain-containing protein [Ustulina deusta]|nr:CDP-alcohol phosphatidyltransferase-domain-containing protein [Ustulina deusta]